jgi:hypothetical protein
MFSPYAEEPLQASLPICIAIMTRIENLLSRIADVLDGRSLFSQREQLLSDCRDEILILRRERNKLIEEAAQIVENFETVNNHVVSRMRVAARKAAIAAEIRKLKD